MSKDLFERNDFMVEGFQIKMDLFRSIVGAFDSGITRDAFTELMLEAVAIYGYVVRAQILEGVSDHIQKETLNEALVDKTIGFLARRCDRACARLAELVELIEETKTPGPRH